MIYTIDYFILSITVLINALIFIVTYSQIQPGIRRVYSLLCAFPVFVYSGMGLSYQEIGSEYLIQYLIFSSLLMSSIMFIFKLVGQPKQAAAGAPELYQDYLKKPRKIYKVCSILFLMTFVIYLFIPTIRIDQLWNPPAATVVGGYERIDYNKNDPILNIASVVRVILLPFFMIHLWNLKRFRKNLTISLWIFAWVYLYFLSQEYIGRNELVVFLVFTGFLVGTRENLNFHVGIKHLIVFLGIIVLSIPFFVSYQYIRQGVDIPDIDYGQALMYLWGVETDYPKYYPDMEKISLKISPLSYYLWFLLLPVPSLILPNKAEITVVINQVFSSSYLNLERGATGYYGLVPSLFGESMLIYNSDFYWIHAIFIGILIASVCILMEKIPELSVLNLYFAVSVITLARGGSQGYFALILTSLFVYLLFKIRIRRGKKLDGTNYE